MRFFRALQALWSHDLPHREELDALRARVTALEASQRDLLDVVQSEAEREAKWQDLRVQMRKLLGRLDAHAGHEANGGTGGGQDPKILAAILRSKFPNAGG